MCMECWIEYGSPRVVSALTIEGARMAQKIEDRNVSGGNLHILLDDWNIEDDNLEWLATEGIPQNIHGSSVDELADEVGCLRLFRLMSMDERASALAIASGIIGADGRG